MELTRRDAVVALGSVGVAAGAGAAYLALDDEDDEDGADDADSAGGEASADREVPGPLEERHLSTLVAAAEVLYPSEVEGVAAFVERFVRGRARDQPDHARGVADAATYLDEYANAWHDRDFAALAPETREKVLREMGADTAEPVPDGGNAERVRYYVVNELLYALYTSPTGGKLVGLENPQGYPGGTTSYQRGPRQ